jgi:hypothetical protein
VLAGAALSAGSAGAAADEPGQAHFVGRWKFNEATTAAPHVTPDDLGTYPAAMYGAAAISPDSNIGTGALALDGSGAYAATTDTPLRTDESFTIAGWAETAPLATSDMTVLSIGDGTDSAVTLRWHYVETLHDPMDLPIFDVVAGEWQVETVSGGTPRVHTVVTYPAASPPYGMWTHLAVTYDAVVGKTVLYVNGFPEERTCDPDDTSGCTPHNSYASADLPFRATSGLHFGRGLVDGEWAQPFSGQIDDVWVYQGLLTQAQITSLISPVELDTPTGS